MLILYILIIIVIKALVSLNHYPSNLTSQITNFGLGYCLILSLNIFYFNSLILDLPSLNGFFHVNNLINYGLIFIYFISSIVLVTWPIFKFEFLEVKEYLKWLENEIQWTDKIITVKHQISQFQIIYIVLILFGLIGGSLLISCSDLLTMYLGIEMQSFSLYILSSMYKDSLNNVSSGLKYYLIGGLSSCLIILGTGIIYSYIGSTSFDSLFSLLASDSFHTSSTSFIALALNILSVDHYSVYIGLILIIIGFLTKIASAPLHHWSPDVYDNTSTIVTLWLTVFPKLSIFFFLISFVPTVDLSTYSLDLIPSLTSVSDGTVNTLDQLPMIESTSNNEIITFVSDGSNMPNNTDNVLEITSYITNNEKETNNSITKPLETLYLPTVFSKLIIFSSLFCLIIGSVVGLSQKRIKRLLAYSTISHLGFILLALGVQNSKSIDSFLFYLIQYTITNLNIFLIVIGLSYISYKRLNIFSQFKDIKYISQFKNVYKLNPYIAFCFSVCLFSMAGTPPLIGFFSKQFILYSAILSGYIFMSFVCIIVSVISAYYYLKVISILYRNNPKFTMINNLIDKLSKPTKTAEQIEKEKNKEEEEKDINENLNLEISHLHNISISYLTVQIITFIVKPSLILSSALMLALTLYDQ